VVNIYGTAQIEQKYRKLYRVDSINICNVYCKYNKKFDKIVMRFHVRRFCIKRLYRGNYCPAKWWTL